jgi:uncharacterized protein (TIGR02001 family)
MSENRGEQRLKACVFSTTREGSMKQVKMLSAAALLAFAGAANAGVTSTITATNDYDFRGFSQSATDPALQVSLDYAHDSGWYIGGWVSNVDFGPADVDLELDLYTGFTGKINDDLTWDAGIVYYTYPDESDFNTLEIYGSLAYKWVKGKVSYSDDYSGTGEDGIYLDGTLTVPLPANFSLQAHVGVFNSDSLADDVIDYSFGVGYTAGKFNLALKYVDTDSDVVVTDDVFNNEGRVILTVATTLPW